MRFFIYDTPFRQESRPYITLCDTLIRIVILYHHYLGRRYMGTIVIISLLYLYFYKKTDGFILQSLALFIYHGYCFFYIVRGHSHSLLPPWQRRQAHRYPDLRLCCPSPSCLPFFVPKPNLLSQIRRRIVHNEK